AAFGGTLAITAGGGMVVADMWPNVLPAVKRRLGPGAPNRALQRDPIYRGVILFWFLSPLYVFFTRWEPGFLRLLASAMGLVLMPVMSLALVRLTNDPALMGDRRNDVWQNAGLVLIFVVSSGFLIQAAWTLVRLRLG